MSGSLTLLISVAPPDRHVAVLKVNIITSVLAVQVGVLLGGEVGSNEM